VARANPAFWRGRAHRRGCGFGRCRSGRLFYRHRSLLDHGRGLCWLCRGRRSWSWRCRLRRFGFNLCCGGRSWCGRCRGWRRFYLCQFGRRGFGLCDRRGRLRCSRRLIRRNHFWDDRSRFFRWFFTGRRIGHRIACGSHLRLCKSIRRRIAYRIGLRACLRVRFFGRRCIQWSSLRTMIATLAPAIHKLRCKFQH